MIQEYIKEQKMDFKTKRWLFSYNNHTSPSKESYKKINIFNKKMI